MADPDASSAHLRFGRTAGGDLDRIADELAALQEKRPPACEQPDR